MAGIGTSWRCEEMHGRRGQGWRCKGWTVVAWMDRSDQAGRCQARIGLERQAVHGMEMLAQTGESGNGKAGRGMIESGEAWRGRCGYNWPGKSGPGLELPEKLGAHPDETFRE